MNRTTLIAGALALTLPTLALAQDRHHRDRRGGVSVGFSVSIGTGHRSVGVRSLPHRRAPIVRHVYPDHGFTILAQNGDYYLVDTGFRRGWVHCSQLPGYQHRSVTTVIVRQPVVVAPPPVVIVQDDRVASLDRFDYSNVIEWDGDHVQTHLKLVRQSDGTYLADVDGEQLLTVRARLSEADLSGIKAALRSMQSFPDRGFGESGAHFHTTVSADGLFADGRTLHFSRRFYDPDQQRYAALAGELSSAVGNLVSRIQAAARARGITSTLR